MLIFSQNIIARAFMEDVVEGEKNHYTHFINFTSLRVIAKTHGERMKHQGNVILRGENIYFMSQKSVAMKNKKIAFN